MAQRLAPVLRDEAGSLVHGQQRPVAVDGHPVDPALVLGDPSVDETEPIARASARARRSDPRRRDRSASPSRPSLAATAVARARRGTGSGPGSCPRSSPPPRCTTPGRRAIRSRRGHPGRRSGRGRRCRRSPPPAHIGGDEDVAAGGEILGPPGRNLATLAVRRAHHHRRGGQDLGEGDVGGQVDAVAQGDADVEATSRRGNQRGHAAEYASRPLGRTVGAPRAGRAGRPGAIGYARRVGELLTLWTRASKLTRVAADQAMGRYGVRVGPEPRSRGAVG